ncbi:hypothetical protein E0H26_14830 [Micromonospora zingiberis]|uniref:Uncharacterized protein n=1 Tax=Micromonospora zingiberis TaxID=2053011 RepID=A0A4V2LWK5_9ACTN|nr:hypothetical protein [Micromonospora zingiberis]TCB96875.1 hypothetical protein E0H26_14830 [Micromonospora zingiberis]
MSMRSWLAGVGLVAMALPVAACGGTTPDDLAATSEVTGTPTTGTPTTGTPTSPTSTPTESVPASPTPTAASPELSGTRQVTIVRVDGFESGLSLTEDGRLAEVDDDSGRQLFVPTPLDAQTFQIRAYRGAGGGPGTGEAVCWQVHNPGDTSPLTVQGADCDEREPRQRFTIASATDDTDAYLISSNSAYLRHSRQSGLILEELGDASPTNSFRLNDNGPAPERE